MRLSRSLGSRCSCTLTQRASTITLCGVWPTTLAGTALARCRQNLASSGGRPSPDTSSAYAKTSVRHSSHVAIRKPKPSTWRGTRLAAPDSRSATRCTHGSSSSMAKARVFASIKA